MKTIITLISVLWLIITIGSADSFMELSAILFIISLIIPAGLIFLIHKKTIFKEPE